MPHKKRRFTLWVSCRCCAVQGVTRPVGRFRPQRRGGRQLRATNRLVSLDSARHYDRLNSNLSARSAAPFNWGLSAVVNSSVVPRDLHLSSTFPRGIRHPHLIGHYHVGMDIVSAVIREELS